MKIGAHDTTVRVVVIAELGINHNGEEATCLDMIAAAADAGADCVKFQVGSPPHYVNRELWSAARLTPWGEMTYLEYRERLEFDDEQLARLTRHARDLGLGVVVSPLDAMTVYRFDDVDAFKVASPKLTDQALLGSLRNTGKPLILSTGMSTMPQIERAVASCGAAEVAVLHCTSEYPCPPARNNLSMIPVLASTFPGLAIGYSGHEIGIPESVAAVALGARIVERHLTLSRAMWGSDQAASIEPDGLRKLVKYIRTVEAALGDGVKRVYDGERVNMDKFRPKP